jgi:uncharacterized protein with PQ loop repeat
MDILMISQYVYYGLKKKIKAQDEKVDVIVRKPATDIQSEQLLTYEMPDRQTINHSFGNESNEIPTKLNLYVYLGLMACMTIYTVSLFRNSTKSSNDGIKLVGRKLLQMDVTQVQNDGWPLESNMEIVGYTIGCVSAALYLGSRIPQILKNFSRKSTAGLSVLLFFCAFMGNLTYSVSIFLYSVRGTFLLAKLPWIIGSAGVLMMDLIILLQFLAFRKKKAPVDLDITEENVSHEEEAVKTPQHIIDEDTDLNNN